MLFGVEKLEWCGYTRQWKDFEDMLIRFDRMYERDGHTDRQTDTAWRIGRACKASRGKNGFEYFRAFFTTEQDLWPSKRYK